jgi:hypothetical protein
MVQVLDAVPEGIAQRPGRIWNVLARSLGEQGASGRTALAWRWALTGSCPSPVTLSAPAGTPPDRGQILAEAAAAGELAGDGSDPGGQVMHARFVLQWLAGDLEPVPLWNADPQDLRVTDGAGFAHAPAEIENVYSWALAARLRYPWPGESAADGAWLGFGWAFGTMQLLAWACGESGERPLARTRAAGRPSLYQVSLDARRAMTALIHAREDGQQTGTGRLEAIIEAFLWLAGWNQLPPVDRHGHGAFEDCPEREAPCGCDAVASCLRGECAACWRVACVHGFGMDDSAVAEADAGWSC